MTLMELTILQTWDELEESNPLKSTEWLMTMTADICSTQLRCRITTEHVAEALINESLEKEIKPS